MPSNQPYRPGELDQRVTVFDLVQTTDEYGQTAQQEKELGTFWALARPMSGREREAAQQTEARADHLFVFRRSILSVVTVRERGFLRWRGQDYNIRFIKDSGPRAAYLPIEAERGTSI